MEKTEFKEFVQSIQNKISIAVAVTLIIKKPADLSAVQYAVKIQELVYDQWIKNNDVLLFEKEIVASQRNKILKEIGDLTQSLSATYSVQDALPSVTSELNFYCNSDSENNFDLRSNMSFISSIIQLKSHVETSGMLSFDKMQLLVSDSRSNSPVNYFEEDSGYAEHTDAMSNSAGIVSTNLFRSFTHSSRTDFLIKKCINAIFEFTYNSMLNNSHQMFNSWQGSVFNHLCFVLREVSSHPICTEAIIQFTLKVVDGIMSSEESNKHLSWEFQQIIMQEFCLNTYICEKVIESILSNFSNLTEKINTLELGTQNHLDCIHLIEKVPHLTNLLSFVLKKWHSFEQVESVNEKKESSEESSYKSVTDVWRLKWIGDQPDSKINNETLELMQKWKRVCEGLLNASQKNFCLISILIWDIINLLDEWSQKTNFI